jgi:hypothetical protein
MRAGQGRAGQGIGEDRIENREQYVTSSIVAAIMPI